MRVVVTAVAAALLFGCGNGNTTQAPQTPDAGSGGGGAPAQHALHVRVTGNGEVRSSSPAFSCRTDCGQNEDATTTVHLVALPDAGWKFDGWVGACSGTSGCDLAMSADQNVNASFSALPPPPPGSVRVSVSPTGSGSGRVTSSPAGIDCPGTCSTTVSSGSPLALNEQPDASSGFAGWGGGCSGSGACTVTATADVTVYANFSLNPPQPPPPPPPPPPSNSCAGIPGPDAVVMQQYVARPNRNVDCLAGLGDASGTLAFPMTYGASDYHGSLIDFLTSSNIFLRESYFEGEGVGPLQQRSGLASAGGPPHLWPYGPAVELGSWDSAGKQVGNIISRAKNTASAGDAAGGVLLAGDIASGSPYDTSVPYQHQAIMWTGGGQAFSMRWQQPLASSGPVFGAGVDILGRALVITGGSSSGTITAQWFDKNGTPLTGEFVLLTGFVPARQTWFETSPLIGGGLEVRRMDYDMSVGIVAAALVLVQSGAADVRPAPKWMVDRPNTRLQIARGGRAYAVLPYGTGGRDAINFPCTQKLELVAPDGTSCGARDYPLAAGNCQTRDLTLAEDGTVIQQLSPSMETITNSVDAHTCTWRFWTRAAQ